MRIMATQREIDKTWSKVRRKIQDIPQWEEVAAAAAVVTAGILAVNAIVAAAPVGMVVSLRAPLGYLQAAGKLGPGTVTTLL
jgi:hypothetical protein